METTHKKLIEKLNRTNPTSEKPYMEYLKVFHETFITELAKPKFNDEQLNILHEEVDQANICANKMLKILESTWR